MWSGLEKEGSGTNIAKGKSISARRCIKAFLSGCIYFCVAFVGCRRCRIKASGGWPTDAAFIPTRLLLETTTTTVKYGIASRTPTLFLQGLWPWRKCEFVLLKGNKNIIFFCVCHPPEGKTTTVLGARSFHNGIKGLSADATGFILPKRAKKICR